MKLHNVLVSKWFDLKFDSFPWISSKGLNWFKWKINWTTHEHHYSRFTNIIKRLKNINIYNVKMLTAHPSIYTEKFVFVLGWLFTVWMLYSNFFDFLCCLVDGRPHQLHQSSSVWACRRKANSLCQRWPHLQVSCTLVRVYECEKVKIYMCECVLFSVNDAESLDQISTLKPNTKHNMACCCSA